MQQIHPGVYQLSLGQGESHTPVQLRFRAPAKALDSRPQLPCPFDASQIITRTTKRGFEVHLPLGEGEQIFGLGLQLKSLAQRGKKKTLRVNSDPQADLGDSHAPVPLYVSTAGYAVLIDSARYISLDIGAHGPRQTANAGGRSDGGAVGAGSAEALYAGLNNPKSSRVIVEVPSAKGVDIYIFAGKDTLDAVSAYNLFSGGGCVPPRWGLGVWYRARGSFNSEQAANLAMQMRDERMPCDVYGLEPGWQTHAYSCSWMWSDKFPQPAQFIRQLGDAHYHVNLWTHIFAHRANPTRSALEPLSGDYEVWSGLVPDVTLPQVRDIIADHHEKHHVALGISGYKLDECDHSDWITAPWSFPDFAQFPCGADGEQMHSLLGMGYQQAIEQPYRKLDRRTYGQVRNAHALAASYPFVLYSDLYDHRDFIRGLTTAGFSGLLWSPEVRHAENPEDLMRRLQVVMLSPQALINAWYIDNPPWKQWKTQENNAGQFADGWEQVRDACRAILELRMKLLPYIHAAFFEYHLTGTPPFRALAMDWPGDVETHKIDDQWMIGQSLMAAAVTAGHSTRDIYLPATAGGWYDFWTGKKYDGGQKITTTVPLERIPLFIKAGSLLPLATPTVHTADPHSRELEVRAYGDAGDIQPLSLYEDDDATYAYEQGAFNTLKLQFVNGQGTAKRTGTGDYPQYVISKWIVIR